MANIKNFPNNRDEFIGAENVMKWLHGRTSGVFAAGGNLAVQAKNPAAMVVTVTDGTGWMTNGNGDGCVFWNDAQESSGGTLLEIPIASAEGQRSRIDRIIVEWKVTNYTILPEIKVLQGDWADIGSNPVPKNLQNDSTTRQISLAQVRVPAGTTNISPSLITDERLNNSVCGLVTDGITIDTSTAQNQFIALLNAIQEQLAEIQAGETYEMHKILETDISVHISSFLSDSTYADYPYRAAVAIDGMTGEYVPDVIFDNDTIQLGILAPFCQSYNGGVYLYAKSVPAVRPVISTFIGWKP